MKSLYRCRNQITQRVQYYSTKATSTSTTSTPISNTSTSEGTITRNYHQTAMDEGNLLSQPQSVTSWISDTVANTTIENLSPQTTARSKRMMLDTLGVGIIGSKTEISDIVTRCVASEIFDNTDTNRTSLSSLWGSNKRKVAPAIAAYINGVNVHSMDFDDTWFPATHPSGPVLPAILALAETMTGSYEPTTQDLLVAYNVGIEVQGLLLRCSEIAKEIPKRFHPPAVVGVMGSAAASARLLGLGPKECRHALAIAASFAGAPMANAGTTTKPLHSGKAARFGLEAAILASHGLEGNSNILDMTSGYGAFYDDYDPEHFLLNHAGKKEFILHDQDIAIKRFPAHLGMHWAIDATLGARDKIIPVSASIHPDVVESVEIWAPQSKYINRPLPTSEHEARHSFQFNVCTALLDGHVQVKSYHDASRNRPQLIKLLKKAKIVTPDDNLATFDDMYIEVHLYLKDGTRAMSRCDTPYGHWRNPLSQNDLERKFLSNTSDLHPDQQSQIIHHVGQIDKCQPASAFLEML
ncbi:hypothetical protein LOTGIDRAFT_232322 [Lottia gigantea]|uniref:Cis-aconitate decarboxylase n=1 Tax=Lottia gigantea TaxID=225164 RepID=V4AH39_LOTGI|nr:hypothetical protein LOTGIDRAFT_232322 [Lottia gigantea]ESO94485.1 hypothetical protein LOTGIDRAFT_232322 [Lottia gigantea]